MVYEPQALSKGTYIVYKMEDEPDWVYLAIRDVTKIFQLHRIVEKDLTVARNWAVVQEKILRELDTYQAKGFLLEASDCADRRRPAS